MVEKVKKNISNKSKGGDSRYNLPTILGSPEVKADKKFAQKKLPFRTSDRCPKRMRKRAARLAVRCAAGGGVSSAEVRKVL